MSIIFINELRSFTSISKTSTVYLAGTFATTWVRKTSVVVCFLRLMMKSVKTTLCLPGYDVPHTARYHYELALGVTEQTLEVDQSSTSSQSSTSLSAQSTQFRYVGTIRTCYCLVRRHAMSDLHSMLLYLHVAQI